MSCPPGNVGSTTDTGTTDTGTSTDGGTEPICSHNYYNCADFVTQEGAQAVHDFCFRKVGFDVHGLDRDGDGIACEANFGGATPGYQRPADYTPGSYPSYIYPFPDVPDWNYTDACFGGTDPTDSNWCGAPTPGVDPSSCLPACPPGCEPSKSMDPIDACFKGCQDMAKQKDAECKRMNQEFVRQMKARGCKSTVCKTASQKRTVTKKKKKKAKGKRCGAKKCVWVKRC